MASNTIVERVAADLSNYPPFDVLEPAAVQDIASSIAIHYHEEGEMIFRKGDTLREAAFMVMKGAVRLFDSIDGQEVLVDLCDEGDIFGVRAIFGGSIYMLSAQVAEESLIYEMPAEKVRALIAASNAVSMFFAGEFAKSMQVMERSLTNAFDQHKLRYSEQSCRSFLEHETLEVKPVTSVITCAPDISILDAAKIMSDCNIGSILVVSRNNHPLGIITDTDLRKKVVAQPGAVNERPVRDIMSSPIYTITGNKTVADMVMLMVKTKLRHFCVTEDGTPDSALVGIISEHDIITSEGNNPAVIMKEIMASEQVGQLKVERDKAENLLRIYIRQDVAVHFISNIITEINDAVIVKAIRFSIAALELEGMRMPGIPFCWLSLGSEGRKEQLLRTDQDNALLYADPPSGREKETHAYFVALGRKVTGMLEQSGFVLCPAEVMASNDEWCQPISVWIGYFSRWILTPEPKALMNATIFFDFRPVYGDTTLAAELKKGIFEEMSRGRGFLEFFAKNALQNPPPLGFFRNFLVEKSRDHANEFDIKSRAMMPLSDAARLLIYEQKIPDYLSTVERFQKLADLLPAEKDLCLEAAAAYEFLMRLRVVNGLEQGGSGRYIKPESLNKIDRQMLRNVFSTIGQVQKTLNMRFQLDYIRD
ncbi:MAG: CBS domain-containing protein [Chlorobiaceae bacterium]|nr:CBS domain-containing protein [Chlorobiaceae bacterium]